MIALILVLFLIFLIGYLIARFWRDDAGILFVVIAVILLIVVALSSSDSSSFHCC
jgi:cell division protein FtsW (lipid II flippase)